MITKITKHDKCQVRIVLGYSHVHYAHLECCDPKCKRKKKFIQWIGARDHQYLEKIGIPAVESPVIKIGKALFDRNGVKI
jgi:hypothetical protein